MDRSFPIGDGGDDEQMEIYREREDLERYEIGFGPHWKSSGPPFSVKIHSPVTRKDQWSTNYHTFYSVTCSFVNDQDGQDATHLEVIVDRRYSHFERLALALDRFYGEVIVLPRLPDKKFAGRCESSYLLLIDYEMKELNKTRTWF